MPRLTPLINLLHLSAARPFYTRFPSEPSKTTGFDMQIANPVFIDEVTLTNLLSFLQQRVSAGDKQVLIVCHGQPTGFFMKVVQGSPQLADNTGLSSILKLGTARDQANSGKVTDWAAFLAQFNVVITGKFTPAEAKAKFDQFFASQLQNMGLTTAQFDQVWSLRGQILNKVERLEIRACNLAFNNNDPLKLMSIFFGVKTIVAPKSTSFFIPPLQPVLNRSFHIGPPPTSIGPRQHPVAVLHSGERFFPDVSGANSFFLRILDLGNFQFSAQSGTLSAAATSFFVTKFIMNLPAFSDAAFPIHGLLNWTTGTGQGLSFVMPGETPYRDQLVEFSAAP